MYIIRKHFKDGLENFAFVFCLGTYFAFVDQSFFPFQRRREAERVKVLVFFLCECQQQRQWVPILQKSSKLIMHGEWFRGFISFLAKIPLIGMLSALHQFIKSIFKRGTSLNLRFFSSHHPKSRRRGARMYMLFPLGGGSSERLLRTGGLTCMPLPNSFDTRSIAKGTRMEASMPKNPPYCAGPPPRTTRFATR